MVVLIQEVGTVDEMVKEPLVVIQTLQEVGQHFLHLVVVNHHLMGLEATPLGQILGLHHPIHVLLEVPNVEAVEKAQVTVEVRVHHESL
jgi:hypothetical protein